MTNLEAGSVGGVHRNLQLPMALTERRYIILSRGGLVQRAPLQTQSVHTILTAACTDCKCLPEIATAPLGPRNDKLEGLAPQNACRKDCQLAWRSLSAATDAIGTCYFIDALYGLQMPARDCHGPFGASQ